VNSSGGFVTSRPFRVGIVAICISTSVGIVNFIVFVKGTGSGKSAASALFTFLRILIETHELAA
jgi:hypothetical protein